MEIKKANPLVAQKKKSTLIVKTGVKAGPDIVVKRGS